MTINWISSMKSADYSFLETTVMSSNVEIQFNVKKAEEYQEIFTSEKLTSDYISSFLL